MEIPCKNCLVISMCSTSNTISNYSNNLLLTSSILSCILLSDYLYNNKLKYYKVKKELTEYFKVTDLTTSFALKLGKLCRNNIPCKDCIVLPICRQRIRNQFSTVRVIESCSILQKYLNIKLKNYEDLKKLRYEFNSILRYEGDPYYKNRKDTF